MSEQAWRRLSRAAGAALAAHLVAGLAMALVLRRGLESESDLEVRMEFLAGQRLLWTLGWLPWTLAALSILFFCHCFRRAHGLGRLPVLLVLAAVGLDLAAQAIEVLSVPPLAAAGDAERLVEVHRTAVLLTGFGANGLYTLGVVALAWTTRREYGTWMSGAAVGIAIGGTWLSAAAWVGSASGMVWSNAVLVPALLLWLFGVRRHAGQRR